MDLGQKRALYVQRSQRREFRTIRFKNDLAEFNTFMRGTIRSIGWFRRSSARPRQALQEEDRIVARQIIQMLRWVTNPQHGDAQERIVLCHAPEILTAYGKLAGLRNPDYHVSNLGIFTRGYAFHDSPPVEEVAIRHAIFFEKPYRKDT